MSLQSRVMAGILVALAVGLAAGGTLAAWNAKRSVAGELRNAMLVRADIVQDGLADAAATHDPDAIVRQLVRAFDGDRHVRARLLDASGRVLYASRPHAASPAPPAWLAAAFDPRLPPVRLATPARASGLSAVVLDPEPANEIGEVWGSLRDGLLILALSAGLALILVRIAIGQALRPLGSVAGALGRVGEGDYDVRVAEVGPAETRALAGGFNAMAGRLDAMDRENSRLQEQLLTLQEEERSELARDLHDDIGPYLFAVHVDAAAIGEMAGEDRRDIGERARLILGAVGHMQAHVRDILGRLRPLRAVELGLVGAVQDLFGFWRLRRPQTIFDLAADLDEGLLGLAEREALYRVIQEALSNAVRHGRPGRIAVRLRREGDTVVAEVADDGGALAEGERGSGYGLMGMRERLAALGGELAVTSSEAGWKVRAEVPVRVAETA